MPNIVWILGAGFSKSLGGPLLPSLLSERSEERIQAAYEHTPTWLNERAFSIIRQMLRDYGWEQKSRSPAWVDAEEFLEQLDTAASTQSGRIVAQRLLRK